MLHVSMLRDISGHLVNQLRHVARCNYSVLLLQMLQHHMAWLTPAVKLFVVPNL